MIYVALTCSGKHAHGLYTDLETALGPVQSVDYRVLQVECEQGVPEGFSASTLGIH
jgi:hypothetical protein